jgi:hypothetical protein
MKPQTGNGGLSSSTNIPPAYGEAIPVTGNRDGIQGDNVGLSSRGQRLSHLTVSTGGTAFTWRMIECDDGGDYPVVFSR